HKTVTPRKIGTTSGRPEICFIPPHKLLEFRAIFGSLMHGLRPRNLRVAVFSFLEPRSGHMMRQAFTRFLVPVTVVVSLTAATLSRKAMAEAPDSLVAAAREAGKSFQAASPQELAKAKAALATAADNLDRFLRRNASAAVTKSWKDHLHWN